MMRSALAAGSTLYMAALVQISLLGKLEMTWCAAVPAMTERLAIQAMTA